MQKQALFSLLKALENFIRLTIFVLDNIELQWRIGQNNGLSMQHHVGLTIGDQFTCLPCTYSSVPEVHICLNCASYLHTSQTWWTFTAYTGPEYIDLAGINLCFHDYIKSALTCLGIVLKLSSSCNVEYICRTYNCK